MHPDVPRIQCFQNFYIEISNKSTSSPQTTETTRKTKMTIDATNFQNLCISIFKTSFKKSLSVIKWKRFLIKRNLYYQTIKFYAEIEIFLFIQSLAIDNQSISAVNKNFHKRQDVPSEYGMQHFQNIRIEILKFTSHKSIFTF